MKNKYVLRFVQSLLLLPITASGFQVGNLGLSPAVSTERVSEIVFLQRQKEDTSSPEVLLRKVKADAINAYFQSRGMPLKGYGEKMVIEAEKNDLDWRLLPAIAIRESTGGKFACQKATHNPFGWGSCKIGFKSDDEAIETVARNLGGNNLKTAHHYDNKTTKQILNAYNPPSIVPRYAEQVLNIMNVIGDMDVSTTLASANK